MTEMFRLFETYREIHPRARFLFITGHPSEEVERLAMEQGVKPAELVVVSAKRDEVPNLIAAADIGVSFILATYSAKASCPTKFGEMLAMGVPVIANGGVGDIAEIIHETGAGAVVERCDRASLSTAIAQAKAAAKDRDSIRAAAIRYFDLDAGVDRYDAIYRSIERDQKLS
jgi:glycosyltransferase involved in cell wall biosynthesis